MSTREIVEAFVDAINGGRAERVVSLMDPYGVFIDALGDRIEGRAKLVAAWRAYFQLFPDYKIELQGMLVDEQEAMLHGWAGATLHRGGRAVEGGAWRIPAAWRAATDVRRVLQWQVYADNKPVYALLERP
jgi:ketosteroid isomerase-like protein